MARLQDKVCVITGAGGGMGREAAILFTEEGAKVCAADLNLAAAEETAGAVRRRRRLRVPGERRRGGQRQGDDGRDRRALRRHRRPLQQRRHLARRRRFRPRHVGRGLGPCAGREHARRLPLLQARDPASARAGRRVGDQRRQLRRRPRRRDLPDLLLGVEGRGALDVARARGAIRASGRARERALPRARSRRRFCSTSSATTPKRSSAAGSTGRRAASPSRARS